MATINAIGSSKPIEVSFGGTGLATLTAHSVQVGTGTSAITQIGVGTNGQVLIGATTADPAFATLTSSGGTITFTPGANTLNLESAVTPGTTWQEVTGPANMVANNGYIANNAGTRVEVTIPVTVALGAVFEVANKGAAGWKIIQQAGQSIRFGFLTSTGGATGFIQSSEVNNCVKIVCITANTEFMVVTAVGNITVS